MSEKRTATRHVNLPLEEDLYLRLRAEAERTGRPATRIVREAIERFLEERRRTTIHEAIASYAAAVAGSRDDLDPDLEAAAAEFLRDGDAEVDGPDGPREARAGAAGGQAPGCTKAEGEGPLRASSMRRGDVFLAGLAPRSGSEQRGTRPVVVVSHDAFNRTPGWRSVVVVPLSTSPAQARRGPTSVAIPLGVGGLAKDGIALCHQVTTLDRAKLVRWRGALHGDLLAAVDQGLKAALDLP